MLIILCFLLTFTAVAAATDDPNHISINCGRAAPATALNGRRWLRDAASQGSSTTATVKGDLLTAVDPVPYYTARISHSQFSYSFHITPGQKLVRFHFNPVSYHGFQSSSDFFSVEAGPFTLLANISASVTARVLAVDTFIREFCVILEEHRPLHIVFSPETSPHSKYTYAFINGIEIISVSSPSSYCHGGDEKVPVVGKKYAIHVENSTALEMVHRQDIKWGSVSSDDDMDGMFGLCAKKGNKAYNRTWRVSVDVGFRYLVRIHMCELGIIHKDFMLLINNMTVLTSTDIIQQRGNQTIIWYNNYMVIVEGRKREGKRMIYISLHSQHEFLDRHGPFEGFQIFKLSNHDRSLAGHNPLPPGKYSTSHTTQSLLSHLGRKNVIATVVFTVICMLNIIVYLLQQMLGADSIEEENQPSERAKRHCRCFSLAELQSATENFHISYVLGRGGFGKVYKGFIDNRREIVAIKRSKPDSNQGEHQFWTEVETLSELRHANLVSLIGYCKEQREMMLVYEYMPGGTLADHLYKLARKGNGLYPLSWKQRLKICIGAGRALDYLHTGHGIIHRDVKTSNILLDGNFVAKVSDFGLAKTGIGCDSQTQDTTKFKGTVGYIDPDYFKTHKITKKSDTYAFGVVLLEVLCGRPAVEPWNEEEKRSLTMWAKDNICKGQFDHIIAPSLRGEISPDSLKTFVKVAERCLHDEPKKRPAIARVVIKLEFAFQQQELAESLVLNEKASGEDVISCTDKSQENVNLLVPNEDKSVGNDLPGNDRTIVPVNLRPTTSSFNEQTVASLPREHTNSRMINSGRKSMMLRISQKLWPWNAFRKIRKPSNKTDSADILASAPIAHRTSNIASQGSTITYKRATGMILTPTLKIFSFEEVKTATRNFSEETVLGEGSYGKVYKGWIHKESDAETQGGSIVAIKKLNHESMQGFNRWQSEVNFLGRLSHPNLVKLLGYGWDDEELFLVYEYIPCGTLADHLYKLDRKSNDLSPLSWKQRLMICIGVGRALDYLQTGHGIIHHHVNASNILLDGMFRAKLSDFSLAVAGSGSESETQDSINPIGTSGYTGTNYYRTRKLTTKGDTYSFGVLLLEVLCGGPTMDQCNGDDKGSLPMWAINNISKGQVDNIVAPSLRGEISPDSLKTFVKVAERCLHEEPKKRPASAHIIIELELALQQQEKAESLSPKENTSAKNASSSTDTCQKKGGGGDEGGGGSGDGGGAEGSGNKGGGSRDGGGGSGGGGEGGASVGGGSRDGGGGNSGGSEGSNGEGGGGGDGGGGDNGGCKDSSSDGRGGGDDDGGDSESGDDGGGKGGDSINVMGPNEKINVSNSVSPSVSCQILPHPDLRIFTFSELKAATRNFRSDMILGQGGFGIVYKGWVDGKSGSGTLIAVKRLHPDSWQGITEWQSELNFLGRLSHPNLVKLLGYCWEDKELLLVYEFMAKGSLDNHLFRRGASVQPLPWDIRLKILIGAAHGLAFLHASDKTVIYRDFKPSNILLDESFNAKLSDFGLAKMGPTNSQSHVTTQVMGTFGHAAPEYVATGHLYVKSDVYSFGVVVVEMLTGLRALDSYRPSGQHCLTDWIKPHLSDMRKLKMIIDARLEGKYPPKSAQQIARLALSCLKSDPKNRPSMEEVVETLEKILCADNRPRQHGISFSHRVADRLGKQLLPKSSSTLHQVEEATQSRPFPVMPRFSKSIGRDRD